MKGSPMRLHGIGAVLVFTAFFGGIFAFFGWFIYASYKRRKALEFWCRLRGFDLGRPGLLIRWGSGNFVLASKKIGDIDEGIADKYPAFEVFDSGIPPRYAFNIWRGKARDRDILGFDYRYWTTGSDADRGQCAFTAVIVSGSRSLTPLHVSPQVWREEENEPHGAEAVSLREAGFDKEYYVECRDAGWARQVLSPEVRKHMQALPCAEVWTAAGDVLVKSLHPVSNMQDLDQMLAVAHGILDGAAPHG